MKMTGMTKLITSAAMVLLFAAGCATSPNFKKSEELYGRGEYDDALTYVEQVLAENPHDEDALILKGKIMTEISRKNRKYREVFLGFQ